VQLNGNQKGAIQRINPNLSCPRNGKWIELFEAPTFVLAPLVFDERWEGLKGQIHQPGYRPTK
jgi:hypothetical protein